MIYSGFWQFDYTKPFENFIFKQLLLQNTIVWNVLYGLLVVVHVISAIAHRKIQLRDNRQYNDK